MGFLLEVLGFLSLIVILFIMGIYCDDLGNMYDKYYTPICGFVIVAGLLIIMYLTVHI